MVSVVKDTPRERVNRGNHVHVGEDPNPREHHRPLEVVICNNGVGHLCIAGGLVGGVGLLAGSVDMPVPHPRAGDARVWCARP